MHTSQRQCFDAHDPRFKCCCGSIHVKTGALVVAILMAITLGLNLISNVVNYANSDNGTAGIGPSIAGAVIGGVVCALLFYDEKTVALTLFFVLLITVIIQVWFFWVVYKCYVFFRLQCTYIHNNSHTVHCSLQAPPGCNTVYVNTAPVPEYNTTQVNTAPHPGYAPQQQYQTAYMSQPPPNYAPQELEIGYQK
uniref:Uncharacterized protein n=1 Tax=Plectus sambesii TaxID=2011161 RepID=A0A914X1N2_9BILA